MSSENTYDLVVVGGGPAGLTAALYAARERMKVVVVEKLACGGEPVKAGLIENYPGFPEGIEGGDLAVLFREQASRFGAEFVEFQEVTGLIRSEDDYEVTHTGGSFRGKAILVSTGGEPRALGIPGEKELTGKGVSYCATCDGPLYRERPVAVIGGGNSAMEEALFLARFASRVFLVHRREEFRGAKILEERLRANERVELVLSARPVGIEGKEAVEALVVRQGGRERSIPVSAVFFFVGVKPNSGWLQGVLELDEAGRIITDEGMRTSLPGVFAAGDVRSGNLRQISIACGEGTVACLAAREYLQETANKPGQIS